MITRLKGTGTEVCVDPAGPIIIVGEKLNPTGSKKLTAALQEGNLDYVRELALKQVAAGADLLDVNVGVPGLDDVALLPQVVRLIASCVDVPLCLDSANPEALAAGLEAAPGKPLVNSVNGEAKSLEAILPVVHDREAAVIGLTMDEEGISNDPHVRLSIAERLLERAVRIGIPAEDVIIDPLVLTAGADHTAPLVTLRTIELVKQELGANINVGASNVSFGLPDRTIINQAFLALAAFAGANCMITDPLKWTPTIRALDLLLSRDPYAARYIEYYRSHPKENAPNAAP